MKGLAIKDVAEQTGLTAGTIRVWEHRYGFPEPGRTPAGYRVYSPDDVTTLQKVVALRARGLSVPAALERARSAGGGATDRPSIYGALAAHEVGARPQRLRKSTLIAISRAIEDEALARAAGPVVIGAFQAVRNYRAVQHRYERLAQTADVVVAFADFGRLRVAPAEPIEVPVERGAALGHEWAVVVDAPGYAACLVGWETPESEHSRGERPDRDRCFEAVWTMDPAVVRRAALVGAALTRRADEAAGARIEGLLADRPLAVEAPAPGLTALTNRMLAYMDAG